MIFATFLFGREHYKKNGEFTVGAQLREQLL